MKAYPIFLIGLAHRRCVVVGGGREAEYKVQSLLDSDAAVTIISAKITRQLHALAEKGVINWVERNYQRGDLAGAFLVIATGRDPETNAQIWEEAESEGVLMNVVDDPAHCNFIAGSIVRRGPLTIAISTGGNAPALAVRLRQRLEDEIGPEYGEFLELVEDLRGPLTARYSDFQKRRALWYSLVDSDVITLLREGKKALACQRISEIIGDGFEQNQNQASTN